MNEQDKVTVVDKFGTISFGAVSSAVNDLDIGGQLATTTALYHRPFEIKSFCKCGKCGKMAEVDTSMVLTSYPPQYNYYCPHCHHHGYTWCDDVVTREQDTEIDTNNQTILTTCLICGETTAIPAKPNYNKNVVCNKCKKAVMKLRRLMECDSDDKGNCLCR